MDSDDDAYDDYKKLFSDSDSESESESESEFDSEFESESPQRDYGESESDESESDEDEKDEDETSIDIEIVPVRKDIKKPKKGKGKEKDIFSMRLDQLTEKILKRLSLSDLQKLARRHGLDARLVMVIDEEKKKKNPIIKDYIKALLNPQKATPGGKRREFTEDAGEDSQETIRPLEDDKEATIWVLDKRRHPWANSKLILTLVNQGKVKLESLYYYEWVDVRDAICPQREPNKEGYDPPEERPGRPDRPAKKDKPKSRLESFLEDHPYIPPVRNPTKKTKSIGVHSTQGRKPINLEPESLTLREPPPGYEGPRIGERVSFGGGGYKGFLTRTKGPNFYISGVIEPFNYNGIVGNMPTAIIPAPEDYFFSENDKAFLPYIKDTVDVYFPGSFEFYMDNKETSDVTRMPWDPPSFSDRIVGIVVGIDMDSGPAWIYDFTMLPPVDNDTREFIPVNWNNQPVTDAITQYVSVATTGLSEGTVIGYTEIGVKIHLEGGGSVKIPLNDPTLRIIPGKGDQGKIIIPTTNDILLYPVTPDMRLAVVEKLFNVFSDVIPDLVEKDVKGKEGKEEEEGDIPSLLPEPILYLMKYGRPAKKGEDRPLIQIFKTWEEYFNDQLFTWFRAKYRPQIIRNLPIDELKQKAYSIATMGLNIDDLTQIHDLWGIELVNSLDANYIKRLGGIRERKREQEMKTAYYKKEGGRKREEGRGRSPDLEAVVAAMESEEGKGKEKEVLGRVKRFEKRGEKEGEEEDSPSFFSMNSWNMLQYFRNANNKTIFEIEIERGLSHYQPYQPPQPPKVFKLVGAMTATIEEGKEKVIESVAETVGGRFIPEGMMMHPKKKGVMIQDPYFEKQPYQYQDPGREPPPKKKGVVIRDPDFEEHPYFDPEVTYRFEKTQLAEALTRMTRSYMINFPRSEDRAYEELVEEEIYNQFRKLIPWSAEDQEGLTEVEIEEGTARILAGLDEFRATHGKEIEELYGKYEDDWNKSLEEPNSVVEEITKKQKMMRYYQGNIATLRDDEIEIKQDPDSPGRIRSKNSLKPEERRVLNEIEGNRMILERDILLIEQQIQVLGTNPRTGFLSAKGHGVRSEIEWYERDCMVTSNGGDITKHYLKDVLYPLIFLSADSSVSRYATIFRAKIANKSYEIRDLIEADLDLYFPEFCMKNNNEEVYYNCMRVILDTLERIVEKFVREFINAKYVGPRMLETRPEPVDPGFDWSSATISPQEICQRDTGSGRTVVRGDGYKVQYGREKEIKIKPIDWSSEYRTTTEIEQPLYKNIEDGDIIIEHNLDIDRFICHSKPEVILNIAYARKHNLVEGGAVESFTGFHFSKDFVERMEKRYKEEIDEAIENMPANFIRELKYDRSRVIGKPKTVIYHKDSGLIEQVDDDDDDDDDDKGIVIGPKAKWNDLKTFLDYIKQFDKVMVLFCNSLPLCVKTTQNVWPDITSEYSDASTKFFNINTEDFEYGGAEIAKKYKNYTKKENVLEMKVPTVILFKRGKAAGRVDSGRKDNIIKLLNRKK
uniref:Uncharacterized protein n=1 Tax=Marseillevirus LCMAC101 TaxID=2506602 RepID=A0A481YRA8_9VIRU|nr:MAG: hypothetical protein LCMAC101_03130 [Marseillevirus LCMAC101]